MRLAPAAIGLALIAVACSGDGGQATSTTAPAEGSTSTSSSTASSIVASSTIPVTTSPTSSELPTTTPASTPVGPLACVAGWTTRQLVAQLVMPGVRGEDLAAAGLALIDQHVGGILVMTWPEGLTAKDLQPFHDSAALPMLLAVDEEGGDVQRLRRLERLPAAADVAATMTPTEAQTLIAAHAEIVAALGFDVVFAPVVDVGPAGGGGPIGDRSFGDDSDVVTEYASAYVMAWRSVGIVPVLKHFPGHGRATADSHNGTSVTPPLSELRQIDLLPYRSLAGSGVGVMVGHLDVPGLTEPGLPASLSPAAITGLLRGELGYADALVFTDALGMGAIASRFTMSDAAVRAIAAGADVALVGSPADVPPVIDALAAAVDGGTITTERLDAALTHVLAAKRLSC